MEKEEGNRRNLLIFGGLAVAVLIALAIWSGVRSLIPSPQVETVDMPVSATGGRAAAAKDDGGRGGEVAAGAPPGAGGSEGRGQ